MKSHLHVMLVSGNTLLRQPNSSVPPANEYNFVTFSSTKPTKSTDTTMEIFEYDLRTNTLSEETYNALSEWCELNMTKIQDREFYTTDDKIKATILLKT